MTRIGPINNLLNIASKLRDLGVEAGLVKYGVAGKNKEDLHYRSDYFCYFCLIIDRLLEEAVIRRVQGLVKPEGLISVGIPA
ncbi:hypothetical protein NDU88_002214 [Pleurodeles waltl]|uniref:Uncharacterized protein n=1 Tax=Pleurodeles waltl TaxID=8319 RepID=A0AAV7UA43_PLEWA|nr:hypothetical protein NDU88_002214 [Pleurodeles waltl]